MAAGSTYTPIQNTSATGVSTITLSSIPATYTDLVVVINGGAVSNILINFNGVGGSAYSDTEIIGDGSSASSGRHSSRANMVMAYTGAGTTQSTFIYQVMNYANTTTYKTTLGRVNDTSYGTSAYVGLWQSTAAINSITFVSNGSNFASGTTFTLYGILAA
jgi:hypothetical protein